MKKIFTFILLVFVLTLTFSLSNVSSNVFAASNENILENGDFENGLDNWVVVKSGSNQSGIDTNIENQYQGVSNFWMNTVGNNSSEKRGLYQTVEVKQNTWYVLTFYGKLWANDNMSPQINYGLYTTSGEDAFANKIDAEKTTLPNNLYSEHSHYFYTGNETSINVGLYFNPLSAREMGIQLDTFSLIEVDEVIEAEFEFTNRVEVNQETDYTVKVLFKDATEKVEMEPKFSKTFSVSNNKFKLNYTNGTLIAKEEASNESLAIKIKTSGGKIVTTNSINNITLCAEGTLELDDTEVIENGGFENGFSNWISFGETGLDTGSYAYKGQNNIYIKSTGSSRTGIKTDVTVEKNSWYKISFFGKKWAFGNIVSEIEVILRDADSNVIDTVTFKSVNGTSDGKYVRYEGYLYTYNNTVASLELSLQQIPTSETYGYDTGYQIDEVHMRKLDEIKEVSLTNGNMTVAVGDEISLIGTVTYANNHTVALTNELLKLFKINSSSEIISYNNDTITASNLGQSSITLSHKSLTSNAVSVFVSENPYGEMVYTNLLLNGGFENNKYTLNSTFNLKNGWNLYGDSLGIDNNVNNQRNGLRNLWIKSNADSNELRGIFQTVEVSENSWYRLTYYAKKWAIGNRVSPLQTIIYAGDTPSDTVIVNEKHYNFTDEYSLVEVYFYSGENDKLTVGIALETITHAQSNFFDTGYQIDDVELYEVADASSPKLEIERNAKVGETVKYSIYLEFDNEFKKVDVTNSPLLEVSFESTDSSVLEADGDALYAKKAGNAVVTMTLKYGNTTFPAKSQIIYVDDNTDGKDICDLVVELSDEYVTTKKYTKINVYLYTKDGSSVGTKQADINIEIEDDSIITSYSTAGVYYIIGRKTGETTINVTLSINDLYFSKRIKVAVNDENLIVDGGFEDTTLSAWTLEHTVSGGHDYDTPGSRSGKGNIFFMAPVYQNPSLSKTGDGIVYQDITVTDSGKYTLSAYINRFEATFVSGYGGNVTLGIVKIENGNVVDSTDISKEFGITYGAGGYQEISHVFDLTPGEYRVYIKVKGDPEKGIGLQVDDVSLIKTVYPVDIQVTLGENYYIELGTPESLNVAYVFDGNDVLVPVDIRYINISSSPILNIASSLITGKEVGETTITIAVTYLDREYTKEITIHVVEDLSSLVEDDVDVPEPEFDIFPILLIAGASLVVLASAVVVTVVIIKRKKKHE